MTVTSKLVQEMRRDSSCLQKLWHFVWSPLLAATWRHYTQSSCPLHNAAVASLTRLTVGISMLLYCVLIKVKVANTRLPSVRFQSWSRLLAVSLQVTWVINPAVGCQSCRQAFAVTPTTLKRAATNFAAWWTEARRVWTVCLRLLPDSVAAAIWTFCAWVQHANHSPIEPPHYKYNSGRCKIQLITRCKAKPVGGPPAYPPRRLLVIVVSQVVGSPASIDSQVTCLPVPCIAIALLVVCRRRRPSELTGCFGGRFFLQNWLPQQRPLRDRKK